MLALKPGVTLDGIQPEISVAITIAAFAFFQIGKLCTITSVTDGRHSQFSLHYKGQGIDIRTRHLTDAEKDDMTDTLKTLLGKQFDVVLEATHIHVEFDPK